jgi:hypothetical protein
MFAIAPIQYSFDVQRDTDISYTNILALRLFALNFWPKLFFTVLEIRPAHDFRTDHTSIFFCPQIGKILGKHLTTSLYTQQPLDGWTRNRMGWPNPLSRPSREIMWIYTSYPMQKR